MKDDLPTSVRGRAMALEVIERENSHERRGRVQDVAFWVGAVAAAVSSILLWPFGQLLASRVVLLIWFVAFFIYAEIYRFGINGDLGDIVSRIRDSDRQVRCLVLFLFPVIFRIVRIIVAAIVY